MSWLWAHQRADEMRNQEVTLTWQGQASPLQVQAVGTERVPRECCRVLAFRVGSPVSRAGSATRADFILV